MKYSKSPKLLYLYNVIFTRLRKLWYTYIIYYTTIDCLRQNKRQNPIHFHPFAGKDKKWGKKGREKGKNNILTPPFLKESLDDSGKKSVVHSHENATHFTISHPQKTSQ